MQISGEANGQDISSQTLFLIGGLSTIEYPLADQVRNYNIANSIIWAIIFRASGWQFDDKNQADLPIATTQLNAGQKTYSLVGSASSELSIRSMRAKDTNGNWNELTPITEKEIILKYGKTIDDFQSGNAIPKFYRPYGKVFDIYDASPTQIANGLECSFDRGFLQIAYNATTYVPGFAPEFHEALSVFAALRFCQAYPKGLSDRIANLEQTWVGYVGEDAKGRSGIFKIPGLIENFYSERWEDKKPNINVKQENNK